MALFVCVVLFLILGAAVGFFGYVHYVKPSRLLDQLATSTSDAIPTPLTSVERKPKFSLAQWLEPIGNLLPVSPQDASMLKQDLIEAGFRSRSAVPVLFGLRIVLAAVLGIVGLVLRQHIENPILTMVVPLAAGAAGYSLPSVGLRRLIKRRQNNIRLSLPDVLDLLTVCTEAGCGLDQAILNVSRELKTVHPAVSEELGLVNMEVMAGKSRAEAMRNFGRRTGEDEVKKLVGILIQTDRFGTSISDALRTQSDFMRIRRRQEAEERAGKVGVKLVFPIFFCCLPSLLIVTAGPGILQLFRNLLPAISGR